MRNRKRTEATEITEAIAYARVSTQEQARSGLGLEAQEARIRAFCEAQGWRLVHIYRDAGVSAATLNRPALKEALDALRPGRVLVALKLDRLTRTARDLDDLTQAVDNRGAAWATVEDNFETRTAMGRAMLRIVATLAQLEREVIAERTVAALEAKRNRRERLGTTPLGYRTVEAGDGARRVEPDPDEQETVRMARDLFNRGLSLRAIAQELRKAGRRTKRGGDWHAETVRLLVRDRYLETIGSG